MATTTLDTLTPNRAAEAPAGTLTCHLVLSPLPGRDGRFRTQTQHFPAGDTLDCYLPEGEVLSRVVLNGGVVIPERYGDVLPQAGDEVWLWPQWGDPATLIGIGVSLVVGITLSVVSHFLFRPKPLMLPTQDKMSGEEERTFSFEGIRTAIGPGGVVPVIYGQHRVGGQLLLGAVDQVATVVDDGQVIPGVAITSIGYVDPQNLVLIVAPGHGFATNSTVRLAGIQGKTTLNTIWTISVVDADSFGLLYSWGVALNEPYLGGGTAQLADRGARSYQAITNPPVLSLMLALCEGPIEAILTDTIEINGQPLWNFPGVQVFTGLGESNQPAIAEFGGARNTYGDGRDVTGDVLTYTSQDDLHAFVLNFAWNEGLFYVDTTGNKQTNTVRLQYRYAVVGTGAWSAWADFAVSADRTAPVRLGVRRENLPLAQYAIQVQFLSALQTDELHAKYRTTLESVTEFQPNTYVYPYTALLGIKALATDQLRGSLPNITVVVRGRRVRVGTLGPVETWSANPSWCVLDLLTNPRYGRSVPDGEIDLTAFATYAAYCDQLEDGETRHVLNYVLDREARAQQVLLEMLGSARGILLKSAGLWGPRATRADLPICLLSWASVTNVSLTYLRDADDVNVMEARFTNEANNWEQDVLTWPPVDQWPLEVHKQSLDLRGITAPTRIMRAMQFELNRRLYENVLLEMDASLEAVHLQVHDLFRFAHPLPGWGVSGRIQPGSTAAILEVDAICVLEAGQQYGVYVRHEDDTVEMRAVAPVVLGPVQRLYLFSVLSQVPVPQTSTWVFGTLTTDMNTRTFRVTGLQRKSDTTVHIEAIIHNPSIYDEPTGTPLPVITTLFNPLGPPPPLLALIATEVTRIQASGTSMRVVNLSWDVAPLGPGYAPYGGATILRRSILLSGQAGQAAAGAIDFGAIMDPNDPNYSYVPLTQVRGHVLDWDDYSVITGGTYQYRVVPVANTGVPNNAGAREVLIHVSGPTTPGYFPGTVQNLRLKGQPVGATIWEGRDLHVEWDRVADSPLFSETFFVQDYVVQLWAPGQLYLLRTTAVPLQPVGQSAQFTYTHQQNEEDQLRAGYAGARRDLQVMVWARTNTGAQSLEPATIVVNNPPPDMSEILPDTTALFEAALINFNQWVEPRDLDHYEVHLDIMDPPIAIYQDVSIRFRKLAPTDLIAGTTYYTYILPFDTFGPGIPSQTASFVPVSLTADKLDSTPPGMPTGLSLTSGTTVSDDGTIVPWVEATWAVNPESDVAGYQLSVRYTPSSGVPTVFFAGKDSRYRFNVPGNLTVYAKVAAFDRTQNISAYTEEVSLATASDSQPPGSCSNLTAIGAVQRVHLLWTPASDLDYAHAEVWASASNDRSTAGIVGYGEFSYEHSGFAANQSAWYWVRAVDTSGNVSAVFHPVSPTAGIQGTAGQLDTTFISSLAANKIIAGTITALVRIGVANLIDLDGVNQMITVREAATSGVRVLMGKLGPLGTDYGLQVFNALGQVMFDARDSGVTAVGIKAGAIQASHVRTDTAVITVAAQIANAIIGDAHITNLSASKIAAGTINVQVSVGISGNIYNSNIFIDGVNRLIHIYDEAATIRVAMGKWGTNYGVYVWGADGALMWDSDTGALARGITDLNVTTAKIANLAVNNAKIANLEVDNAKIANLTVGTGKIADNAVTFSLSYVDNSTLSVGATETVVASITMGVVNAGDQIWVSATTTGVVGASPDTLTVRIREDSVGGNQLAFVQAIQPSGGTVPIATQAIFTAGSALINKVFVVTFHNTANGNAVGVHHTHFVGFLRHK